MAMKFFLGSMITFIKDTEPKINKRFTHWGPDQADDSKNQFQDQKVSLEYS